MPLSLTAATPFLCSPFRKSSLASARFSSSYLSISCISHKQSLPSPLTCFLHLPSGHHPVLPPSPWLIILGTLCCFLLPHWWGMPRVQCFEQRQRREEDILLVISFILGPLNTICTLPGLPPLLSRFRSNCILCVLVFNGCWTNCHKSSLRATQVFSDGPAGQMVSFTGVKSYIGRAVFLSQDLGKIRFASFH